VGVDHSLDGSLRKSFDLTEYDLHRTVDDSLFQAFTEHELERLSQVVPPLLREVRRQPKVEKVAELDRLCGALVGHISPVDGVGPALRRPPPSAGLRRTGLADVSARRSRWSLETLPAWCPV